MIMIKKEPKKEIYKKIDNALANSCYSIITDKKETKSSLEKSKRNLAVQR